MKINSATCEHCLKPMMTDLRQDVIFHKACRAEGRRVRRKMIKKNRKARAERMKNK